MNHAILLPPQLYSTPEGNIDLSKLKALASEYPYCAPAQFYLLHSMIKEDDKEFIAQAAKTMLFFKNEGWLDHQLEMINHPNSSAVIDIPKPLTTPATIENESLIPFEPLHSIDYFASQGITIAATSNSNDKIDKQLRSFTDWLKTMKKIHTIKPEAVNNPVDEKIQSIAENSNVNPDVLTEAMATVFENQGKTEKAIEIYEKLSLLNPSKSAYFAAKITSLKEP